jgi:hypothetical protein
VDSRTHRLAATGYSTIFQVELYTNLVCLVDIQLVFLGIYQTDTGGKLGRYILVLLFWRKPFFPQKGGHGPLFEEPSHHFEGKKGFLPTLKKFPPNSLVPKIPTRIPTDQYQYLFIGEFLIFRKLVP